MAFDLPEPIETFDLTMDDGAVIRLRRHGNPDGPRIMMSHGNGLAIDAYYPFWRHFLDGYELVLHDLRNHGRNPFHGPDHHTYPRFVDDLRAIIEAVPARWGAKPTAGLHHSAASLTSLYQVLQDGFGWDALVLFDPAIVPPEGHPLREQAIEFEFFMVEWAKQRPYLFESPEELAAQFLAARGLSGWIEGAHELMARSTVRETDDGRWTLTCPRELESRIYRENADQAVWNELHRLSAWSDRLLIVSGDREARGAKSPAKVCPLVAEEHGLQQTSVPGTGHFMQIEAPDACCRVSLDFLDRAGFPAGAGVARAAARA